MIKTKKEIERISRINWIAERLEEEFKINNEIEIESFIILKSFKLGVSQRTFKEYLKTAMHLRGFRKLKGKILKK